MKFYTIKFRIILFAVLISCMSQYTFAAGNNLNDYLNEMHKYAGFGGDGGGSFDMRDDMPWFGSAKIEKLEIGLGDFTPGYESITGIKVTWNYPKDENSTEKATSSVGKFGGTVHTVNLGINEFINKIVIGKRYNSDRDESYITTIRLFTSDGDYYRFGETWAVAATINVISSNRHIVGFHGKSGSILDNLSVFTMPQVDFKLVGAEIFPNEQDLGTTEATYYSSAVGVNETDITQPPIDIEVRYIESESFSATWSDTAGVSATLGFSLEAKGSFLGIAEVKKTLSASITGMASWTIGETETEGTQEWRTSGTGLLVPPNKIYAMRAITYVGTATVPFEATYENTYDGKQFVLTGEFAEGLFSNVFVNWIDIGYVDDDKNWIIYDEYEDYFPDFEQNSYSSAKQINSRSKVKSDSGVIIHPVNISEIKIPHNDPGWIRTDEEIAYRIENGLDL